MQLERSKLSSTTFAIMYVRRLDKKLKTNKTKKIKTRLFHNPSGPLKLFYIPRKRQLNKVIGILSFEFLYHFTAIKASSALLLYARVAFCLQI